MRILLMGLALWSPPLHYEVGVGVGAGTVARDPVLLVRPWVGARRGDLAMAVQAPLRLDFVGDGALRRGDWDHAADFGRALRFIRYGGLLQAGTLGDLSLGHGTLVRRFHNGVDDDRHRVGVELQVPDEALRLHAFVDQVFGPPVVGGRAAIPVGPLRVGVTVAADSAAPLHTAPDGPGPTEWLVAGGLDASVALGPGVEIYGDLNLLEGESVGLHLGVLGARVRGDWEVEGRFEGARLGRGYEWAVFDAGYLVDRWRPLSPQLAELAASWGGRLGLTVRWGGVAEWGAEYADAIAAGRADLTVFLRVPDERFEISAFARQRRRRRADLLDGDQAIAALAGRLRAGAHLWIYLTVARAWRTTEAGQLAPFSEAALGVELAGGR